MATASGCSISSSSQGHYLIRWSFHCPCGLASGVTRPPSLAQSSRCRELGLIWSVTLAPRPYRRRRPRPIIAGPASPPDYRVACDSERHVSRPLLPRCCCRSRRLPALQWVSLYYQLRELFQHFSLFECFSEVLKNFCLIFLEFGNFLLKYFLV